MFMLNCPGFRLLTQRDGRCMLRGIDLHRLVGDDMPLRTSSGGLNQMRGDHMYRKKRKGWKSWLFTGEEMVDLQPPWISFNRVEGRRDDGWMELGRNWVATAGCDGFLVVWIRSGDLSPFCRSVASKNSDSRRFFLPKKRWGVVVGDSGGWIHQLS